MINELAERCLVEGCNRKITAIMNDRSMMKVANSYGRYRLGEKGAEELSCSKYFAEQPFLMQKWVKYSRKNQNQHGKEEVVRVNKSEQILPKV
jgi:hypothetical protein